MKRGEAKREREGKHLKAMGLHNIRVVFGKKGKSRKKAECRNWERERTSSISKHKEACLSLQHRIEGGTHRKSKISLQIRKMIR